ncbi:MAG: adenylosuccinate lyase [Nitrospinae bacterium]|nr:adenylosuccinate lyase [Nitrospinota bacterium]
MIERYSLKEMATLWSLESKFAAWLEVEIAACEAHAKMGKIPKRALATIKKKAAFNVQRIDEIEKEVRHDVIAFLTSVAENVGPDSRFIHMGLTSSDVVDTALCAQMKRAGVLILEKLDALMKSLKRSAYQYKKTPCMGRTHGVHAEPTTFGLKIALWHAEMARNRQRLVRAIEGIAVGKISGAVGTHAHASPKIEAYVCKKMGIIPAPISTQIIQRDRHAEYMAALAITAATIEKIALEVRHLQRSEVLEAEEPFAAGQKGSSAMPHKRNPVNSEQMCGLARVVRGNLQAAMEDVALWHERDISHSSVERIIVPDTTILLHYMLEKTRRIVAGLHVYPQRMLRNINATYGLFYSQKVLLALIEAGMVREEAYKVVQDLAMICWREEVQFKDMVMSHAEVRRRLSKRKIEELFSLNYYLKNIDEIFKRVFSRA